MIIDSAIKTRWGLTPSSITAKEEKDLAAENELGHTAISSLELGSRFRVSAQEWLPTWRMIEEY